LVALAGPSSSTTASVPEYQPPPKDLNKFASAFRIDLSAFAMTEIFHSVLIGLIDGERRGRIARAGIAEAIELAIMRGINPS
jgi:hypothetical protein